MKRILLLFIILITFSGCKDDNDCQGVNCLPPETQTGANTFGFLVNGKPINVTNTSQQAAIYQGGLLQLGGGGIGINIVEPFTINTEYSLLERARYQVDPNPQLGCQYEFQDTYQGSVRFTKIDTENFIISGTFEFSTVTDDCENINITNGRFDLQYTP